MQSNNEISATLRQGLQFKKYQDKIAHNLEKKMKKGGNILGREGITNMLGQEDSSVMTQTIHVLNKTEISQSQLQELQQLQTTFNSLLEQLQTAELQLGTTTKKYVDSIEDNVNVKVTTLVENPTSTYIGDFNAVNPATASNSATNPAYMSIANFAMNPMYRSTANSAMNPVSTANSAMATQPGGAIYTYESCQATALKNNSQLFALQNVNVDTSQSECALGMANSNALVYGKAARCSQQADGFVYGNGNTNAIYSTPDALYVGTFGDNPDRAMATMAPGYFTYESCKNYAIANKYQFFGLQDFSSSTQTSQCFVNNSWKSASQYGGTNNYSVGRDGYNYGGGWANAIYQIGTPTAAYIGCYNDLQPNEVMNSLGTGYTFASCQAKAVSNGSPYFALQSFNPSSKTATCMVNDNMTQMKSQGIAQTSVTLPDGKKYGETNINSIYSLNQMGIQANMNKVGYIDENSQLSEYPASMISMDGTINNSPSCTKTITDIDSMKWSNYTKSSNQMSPTTACGLKKALAPNTLSVDNIRTQLVSVADQLIQQLTSLESSTVDLNAQMGIDKNVLDQNLELYRSISRQYKNVNMDNINGIMNDSDIRVLQQNYSYILWSILAIAIIAILINLIRR
jgi:hypothetical protein